MALRMFCAASYVSLSTSEEGSAVPADALVVVGGFAASEVICAEWGWGCCGWG
jgi:hypothetical protein